MEYEDFKNLGLPIGVIEGFGKIHCDEKFLKELYKLDKKFVVLDSKENQLFAAKKEQKESRESGFFVKELLGSQVISRHSSHYGYIGTIVQINDLNYVTVDFGESGKSIVDLGSLDFIAM
jgi:ribosomal 30S subunit maturation factor RimM